MSFYLAATLFFVITTQMAPEREAGYGPDIPVRMEEKDTVTKSEDKEVDYRR